MADPAFLEMLDMLGNNPSCSPRVLVPLPPKRSPQKGAPEWQQSRPGSKDVSAESVLDKIAAWLAPRQVRVRDSLLTFDPSLSGIIFKSQFARAMHLVGVRLTVAEVDVVANRFAEPGQQDISDLELNYERFVQAIENLRESCPRPQEPLLSPTRSPRNRGNFAAQTYQADWSHKALSPVKRLQSKVVEKRLRLYDHFQDFDPLRKGLCTRGQVNTVFTILNIDKELPPDDFKALQDCYTRSGGMFSYVDFCADIDLAFTKRGLEMDPMTQLTMPDASSTLPGRRNRQALSAEAVQKVFDIEERIRVRVRFRRCHLRSAFQDMDRTRRGHVTRSQFARCMGMLDFELKPRDVDTLCLVYCDMGNPTEFNYIDFCASCDPKEDLMPEATVTTSPREECYPRYFECFGAVDRVLPYVRAQTIESPRSQATALA